MKKKIEKFENLHCWQEARILTREVYKNSSKGLLASD